MKKIRKLFNGYINLFTFLTIMAGVVCAALSKSATLLADWMVILVFFLRLVSLEKMRDTQHEIILDQQDTIKGLEAEVGILKKEGN